MTSISVAPLTTWAEVSTSPGSITIPLPWAVPGGHPATVSPTTAAGGSLAHPAPAAISTATIAVAPARRMLGGTGIALNVKASEYERADESDSEGMSGIKRSAATYPLYPCVDAVTEAVDHPLVAVLEAAASGMFPAVDGVAELMPPDAMGTCAVVSFTGHACVLTDLPPSALDALELDGYGAASEANALVHLAAGRAIGSLDVVLVTRGGGGRSSLSDRDDLEHHPRVRVPAITGVMCACWATSAAS